MDFLLIWFLYANTGSHTKTKSCSFASCSQHPTIDEKGDIMQTKHYNSQNRFCYNLANDDIFQRIVKRISSEKLGSSVIVPHVCNNIDVFNGGFAAAVASHYPVVKENYHLLGKTFLKNNLGHTQFIEIPSKNKYGHKIVFANMIAQNGLPDRNKKRCLNYAALVRCMVSVSSFIRQHQDQNKNIEPVTFEIHAPKFGSGIAGGNWNFISDLIEDLWSSYSVFVYNYNKLAK